MDGFQFFNRSATAFYLHKRTYIPQEGEGSTMCQSIGSIVRRRFDHTLLRDYFYTNFTSSPKYRAHDRIRMEFFNSTKVHKVKNSTGYNWMNSSFVLKNPGFHIHPPQWRVLYALGDCAVIKVNGLNNTEEGNTKKGKNSTRQIPHCELWKKEYWTTFTGLNLTQTTSCDEFFNCKCNTTYIFQVYNETLCDPIKRNRTNQGIHMSLRNKNA